MAGRPTDHRNLNLEQLNLDVLFHRAGGKVIWQPRIGCWLSDKEFAGQPLPSPYTGMDLAAIYRELGCSNRIYHWACLPSTEDPRVHITERQLNATDREVVTETPVGTQRAVFRHHPDNKYRPETIKWPVSDEKELRVAAWREAHRTWRWNQAEFDRVSKIYDRQGAATICISRVTVQKLYLEEMGVEQAIYALMDWPAACEAYFEALTITETRQMEALANSPMMSINFGDNIHSATLSPGFFKKYVLPAYQRRCEFLHRYGKFVYAHWDGNCKPLLPFAKETGLDGIEAITPIPQGDVTLKEPKEALGDMILLDGIPAVFFDKTFSEKTLLDCAKECIDRFAPNLVLGISDEISSTGDLDRIKRVGEVVDDYNASL